MDQQLSGTVAVRSHGATHPVTAWTYRVRVWEYLMRQWRPYFVSGIAEAVGGPLLYLLALGLGLGSLISSRGTAVLGGVRYVDYIAPALLCAAALQIAFSECSFGAFGRIKWQRTLWGITSTPVTPEVAADAHVMYISTRLGLSAVLYYLVLLAFGAAGGPAGVLMIPIAVLTAMSVGVWILALSAVLDDDAPTAFNLVLRFGVIPASLFSASFFPISQLPWAVRWLAVASPLWHGNELARDAALGGLPGWQVTMHLVVLVALLVAVSRWRGGGSGSGWRPDMAWQASDRVAVTESTGQAPRDAPHPRAGASGELLLRIIPVRMYAGRSHVVMERSLHTSRTFKWTLISGFFEPLFYLLAMGAGMGSLIGTVQGPTGPVAYAAFIAPGLLATSAMNGAVFDSTVNVFFKLRYAKTYDAMLATSLGPMDVALGEIGWALGRGAAYAVTFEIVMAAMGLLYSPWAALAVPGAILIAFGFAAVGMAICTFLRTFQHLDWVTMSLMPMFLFSTTFYPLDVYPRAVQILVECLPLYHGIELIRGLTLGAVDVSMLGHAAYFVVMAVVGVAVTARRLERLLLT